MKKSLYFLCSSSLLFGLAACSDSESSTSAGHRGGDVTAVENVADLPDCKKSKFDSVYTIESEGADYICFGAIKKWVKITDKLPKCGPSREDEIYYVKKDENAYVCQDEWVSLGEDDDDEGNVSGDDEEKSSSSTNKSSSSKGSSVFDEGDDEESSNSRFDDDDDDDGDDDENPVKSSSSKVKEVTFVDGIIWQPSYGKRARTGLVSNMTEYNFTTVEPTTDGAWGKYVDDLDGGVSTALGHFEEEYLNLDVTLVYANFKLAYTTYYDRYEGDYVETSYTAADPYPYAGFSITLGDKNSGENITQIDSKGICVTYAAENSFRIGLASTKINDGGFYEYVLGYTSSPKTVNIPWTDFEQASWAVSINRSTALQSVTSIDFKYTNDDTGWSCSYSPSLCPTREYSNNIKIYKVGTYGSCSGSSSLGDDYL